MVLKINSVKKILLQLLHLAWYLLAAGLILAALLVTVAHLLTPLLNHHRKDVARWASEMLQAPIEIGELHADWRGNIPELTLTQVTALDRETQKPAFEIQEVKLGFQLFTSLWKRKLVLEDVVISGVEVTVIQDASGAFTIKDLPDRQKPDYKAYPLNQVLAWFFSQPYLSLREIQIDFILPQGERRALRIKNVSLRNQGDEHSLQGSFLLQQAISTEVKAQIEWQGQIRDLAHIRGKAFLDLEGVSLAQWLQGRENALSQLFSAWQIQQGLGGASIWLTWEEGQVTEIQSVFQWYDLVFYSLQDKKTYSIDHLSGHLGWKQDGENQIIAGDNLLINFPGHFWPATAFSVTLRPVPKVSAAVQEKKAAKKMTPLQEGLALAEAGVKKSFEGGR